MSGAIKAYDSRLHQSNQGPGVHRQSGGRRRTDAMYASPTLHLHGPPSAPRWLSLKFTAIPLNFSILPTQGLSPGRKGLLPSLVYELSTDPFRVEGERTTDRQVTAAVH